MTEREREREHKSECVQAGGEGQRERGERIPSRLRAVSMEPDKGLNPKNREIMI